MSRQITALYDTRADAEAAKSRLTAANVDADNVRIVDQSDSSGMGGSSDMGSSSGMGSSSSSSYDSSSSSMSSDRGPSMSRSSDNDGGGFLSSLKNMFVPDEDRHSYNEGIRRGGSLLYADVDEDDVDQAITILEQTSSVDMDERETSWKSEGWAGYSPSDTTSSSSDRDYAASTDTDRTTGNEEHIQLAEEQLVVGKREVNRGGARIRSYVVERPVEEQVTLREEHVNVERRPVSGDSATAGTMDNDALFQERTIEMTETSEEAVVGKQARVTEELVVSKTAEERTETIHDTVRKTEVEIDETGTDATRGSGMGGTSGSSSMGGSSTSGGSTDRDRY